MSDDTDDQIHENALLASAYLDGEATPDERALVETSPESLADVEAFSLVRTVLGATAPAASLSEREAHLAGALDVWERMTDLERSGEATPAAGVDAAAAAAVLTPASTSEGRRSRGGRVRGRGTRSFGASQWLLGAAATLVVIAGAAAVVRGILDEDPATNDLAIEQADDGPELSDVEANEAAEVNGEDVGSDVTLDPEIYQDQAQADPGNQDGLFPADAGSDVLSDEPAADATEEAADDASASEAAPADADDAEQPAPPPEIDRVELQTTDDLAVYGSLAVRFVVGAPGPTSDIDFEPLPGSCEDEFGIEELLEPATYQGQDVNVGVDIDGGVVYAYTEDCTLVESVPLPPPTSQP